MSKDTPTWCLTLVALQLAIVHMSDQYTRITTGGSPFPKDAPVVGLLFGLTGENGALQIMDADDIPTEISEVMDQQVSLHQAVFPQHSVVAWYRVSEDGVPNEDDLQTTIKLRQKYGDDFVFCSCQTSGDPESLPITLYQVEDNVLVGLENWKLETSEAEKIAVEKVVREQPTQQQSAYATHLSTTEQALRKLKDRLTILVQFLQDTQSQKIPFNPELMRHVQSLVCQLGPLVASAPTRTDEQWVLHMAVTAKTVQTVQGYTDKCRQLQEHRSHQRRF